LNVELQDLTLDSLHVITQGLPNPPRPPQPKLFTCTLFIIWLIDWILQYSSGWLISFHACV